MAASKKPSKKKASKKKATKKTTKARPAVKKKASKTRRKIAGTPFHVGDKVLIRTVTHAQTGRIKAFTPGATGGFLELEEAAWIADTGRFEQAIKHGNLNEVEPVDTCFVNVGAIIDVFPWSHALPRQSA